MTKEDFILLGNTYKIHGFKGEINIYNEKLIPIADNFINEVLDEPIYEDFCLLDDYIRASDLDDEQQNLLIHRVWEKWDREG